MFKISYFNDTISYLLVILQSIIIIKIDYSQAILYSGLCTGLIILLNREILISITKLIWEKWVIKIKYIKIYNKIIYSVQTHKETNPINLTVRLFYGKHY